MSKKPTTVIFVLGYVFTLLVTPGNARAAFTPPPFEALATLAALVACAEVDGQDCDLAGLLADPVGNGITGFSIGIQYNSLLFSFDPSKSGFLCQFSSSADCPVAVALVGQQPLSLLPPAGFTPGPPLFGSTVSLIDTGSEVDLNYAPGEPVSADVDTNVFLFAFDFKFPTRINEEASTVTYLPSSPGVDFTQSSFACSTTLTPIGGCGSSPGTGTTGITFDLVPEVPEPSTWCLTLTGALMAFACHRLRPRRM
jgi:hypothetical protein